MLAQDARTIIDNAAKPWATMPEFRAPPDPDGWGAWISGNRHGRELYYTLRLSLEAVLEYKCAENCSVRATRILFALKAYSMDHDGRLPATPDELVPEYLDAVPLDDYDGKPLRYDPAKRIVYSVGRNLTDDGGLTRDEACDWFGRKWETEVSEADLPPERDWPDPSWPIEF
jgi:hypothetical protein